MKFQDRFIKKVGAAILSTSIIAISLIMAPIKVNADQAWPEGPEIASPCAVVMEVNTGTVLYEKNPDDKRPLASLSKMMTFLIAIEAINNKEVNKEDIIVVDKDIAKVRGSSYHLKVGEKVGNAFKDGLKLT